MCKNLGSRLLALLGRQPAYKDFSQAVRVPLVTYQTVIAVRYPDLVHTDAGVVSYGMFFSADPGQAGGVLPIVWGVPGTDMEADAVTVVTDYLRKRFQFGSEAADSLTVLHNRTNMVRVFGNSVTVKNSGGETHTRCVTSCGGSTAFLSVVAQTRRGFLSSGGSARQIANLNETERAIQLEEAYARATVALTRARRPCVLLCPLDQKGPIGAATILGCLQYGLGYLQRTQLELPLWEESQNLSAPSDATFMSRLEAITPTSLLPPLSIVAMRPSPSGPGYGFMRLHLVVVDIHHHWAARNQGVRYVWKFLDDASPYCTPMSCNRAAGAQTYR